MIKSFYLLAAIIMLASCKENNNIALDYTMSIAEFKSANCEPETDACLMVTVTFPKFDSGDSLAMFLANRIIKNSILDNIGAGDAETTDDLSIDLAIEDLDKSFEKVKKDFDGYRTGWQVHINSQELYRNDSIIVLAIGSMTYMGGAHPNRNIRYYNFDRNTGRFVPLVAFVDNLEEFTTRAEVEFKKTYNIEEGTSYDDAGFNFLGDNFILSANYAYLGDSIRLHYNPYEVAAYAAGDFEITVTMK